MTALWLGSMTTADMERMTVRPPALDGRGWSEADATRDTWPAPPPPSEPPPCHCASSTPWDERRKDPPSIVGMPLDTRTCMRCGATLSIPAPPPSGDDA